MTKALQRLNYSEQRFRKILGLKWLRVIRQPPVQFPDSSAPMLIGQRICTSRIGSN